MTEVEQLRAELELCKRQLASTDMVLSRYMALLPAHVYAETIWTKTKDLKPIQ